MVLCSLEIHLKVLLSASQIVGSNRLAHARSLRFLSQSRSRTILGGESRDKVSSSPAGEATRRETDYWIWLFPADSKIIFAAMMLGAGFRIGDEDMRACLAAAQVFLFPLPSSSNWFRSDRRQRVRFHCPLLVLQSAGKACQEW